VSSSVGYDYAYINRELERRRALRAEIAELRERHAALRAQAARLSRASGGRRDTGIVGAEPGLDASSGQLDGFAASLRHAIDATRYDVDQGLSRLWADRVRKGLGSQPGRTRTITTELSSAPGTPSPVGGARPAVAAERAAAVAEAEALLTREASRCRPDDLDRLHGLLTELRGLDDVAAVRERSFEIRTVVKESIDQQKQVDKTRVMRARLLALVEEALPGERERLRGMISAAPDPGPLTGQVAQAVTRADKVRAREAVARAAASALREIGCEVGEEFATLLSERGRTVAAFDRDRPGYGLLVRLPKDQTRLMTAVVRHEDAGADQVLDLEVQREFCDHKLPRIVSLLAGEGVELASAPFLRTDPGQLAVAAAPGEDWPDTTGEHRRRSVDAGAPQVAVRPQERQRAR
jgi:hypothetical protein